MKKKLLGCLNPDINVGRLEEPLQAVLRSNWTIVILLLVGVMGFLIGETVLYGAPILALVFAITRRMPQQPIRPTGRQSESAIGLLQLLAILAAVALLIVGAWTGVKWVIGRFDALFGVVKAKDEQVQQLDPQDTNTTSSVRRYYYQPGIVILGGGVVSSGAEHPIQMTSAAQTAANRHIGEPETEMSIQTDVWEYGCENTNNARKISTVQIQSGPFPNSILLTTTRPAPPEGAVIWYGSPTPDGTNWVVVGGSLPFQTQGTNSAPSSMALLIDVPRQTTTGGWFYRALWDTNSVTAE